MEYSKLEGIGLTRSEIIIYTTLLRIGESSTGKILEEAKISGGKVYQILNKLIGKGLVSYILKNNVRYFSASDPEKIMEYIENKKYDLDKKEKEIVAMLPSLRSLKDRITEDYRAEIYSGFNGFKTAVYSMVQGIDEGSELLSFGGSGFRDISINLIWKNLIKKCEKKKVRNRFIVTDTSPESLKALKRYKLTCKYLPGFHLAPIMVSKNKTMIFNFKDLSVISITSDTISDQFRFFFNSLWDIAKDKP